MNKILDRCPVCEAALEITELQCNSCGTTIKGSFRANSFDLLNTAQIDFVKTFLCCQGNIREVEKALGISYPTVKNRLAEIIRLICPDQKISLEGNYNEVLESIENGSISVDEAIAKLKKINR